MQLLYILSCLTFTVALPFLGKKTNYDEMTARKLLNMAAGAYGENQEECLNRTFPTHETHVVVSTTKEDCDELDNTCESYIAASETAKQLIIVFRGTKSKGQLLLEGLQSTKPGEYFFGLGDVNRYFLNGHRVLWPPLESVLKDPRYAGYKLIFTGHSLGGALAALAAARTAKEGYRPGNEITIYTFGEPRVGDVTFAENFDKMIPDSYRVVFRRDIVPHLPACAKDKSWIGEDEEASRPCDRNKLKRPYHHGTEICYWQHLTDPLQPLTHSRQYVPPVARTCSAMSDNTYHRWSYPDSMEPGSHYIECVGEPKGEDFTCSDKIKFRYDQYSSYIWDHRHYFTVRVPQYGKSGCDITLPEGKPGLVEKVMCFISRNPDCEEHALEMTNRIEVVPVEYLSAPPPTTTEETATKRSSSFGNFFPLVLSTIASLFRGK